jgi:Family of unknown function (DUF6812)
MDVESLGDNDGNGSSDGSLTAVDVGDGWIDAGLTPVNVVVCILECTLSGTTYRMHQQRLLDVLHSSLVANSHRLGKEFVPLTDCDLLFCSGEKEHLGSTHVNKWSILFVAERSGGQPSTSSLPETEGPPFRPKRALSARVRIPPYDLVGKMHADLGQALVHVLDGGQMFLPMTDVIITPPLLTGEWQFSFVAVNKHQIARIEEWSGVPQISALVAPTVRHRKQRAAKQSKKPTRTGTGSPSSPVAKADPDNPGDGQASQTETN